MLPSIYPPFPERREFDIFGVMNPAREVGGDFYDFFLVDEDHLGLVVADVSGKGVPAATDSDNKLFGTDRMLEALNQRPEESARNILADVREAVDLFVGPAEQFDDLTMLCLEYRWK